MTKEIKTSIITYEQFSEWNFIPVALFYVRMATGDFLYIHTSNRQEAQKVVDNELGVGRYTVNASRLESKPPRTESGFTATGTNYRGKK